MVYADSTVWGQAECIYIMCLCIFVYRYVSSHYEMTIIIFASQMRKLRQKEVAAYSLTVGGDAESLVIRYTCLSDVYGWGKVYIKNTFLFQFWVLGWFPDHFKGWVSLLDKSGIIERLILIFYI